MTRAALPRARQGFVYSTTGRDYTVLARRSARTLRALHPGIPIDLFTDQDVDDPVFDAIVPLDRVQPYSKIEALRRSRFDRTILLDADTVAVTRIDELFGMADRHPLSATIGMSRPGHMQTFQSDIPRWFPVLNSGLMVVRRGRRTQQLARAWQRALDRHEMGNDQPHLRRLAWDLGLRVGIVPLEYNLIQVSHLRIWERLMGAPRLLHIRHLHDMPPGDPGTPLDWRATLAPDRVAMIESLLSEEAARAARWRDAPMRRRVRMPRALIRAIKRLTL